MFYTYLWLREDGMPYYAGKGTGDRGFRSKGHRHKCPPKERIVIQSWDSEEDAYEAEKFFILFYGRVDQGTGCLRNLTDGGENPPSSKGRKLSKETRSKMSKSAKGIVKRPKGYKHTEDTKQRMRHKHKVKPRTHCIRGHALTPENLRTNGRSCRICEMENQRLRRARQCQKRD